jgi:hypothetical protein
MTTRGVGSIPLNMHVKAEGDEDLVIVIWTTQVEYAKVSKSAWMEQDWKPTSNKTIQHKEINFLTQYHELEMIHG